mmetsp:Transcript_11446/g.23023  ORF Transcript_11446/g.23023 Transcript_11446/m.23023 type:complete len:217 (-) Transcript_11446:348-998(-)
MSLLDLLPLTLHNLGVRLCDRGRHLGILFRFPCRAIIISGPVGFVTRRFIITVRAVRGVVLRAGAPAMPHFFALKTVKRCLVLSVEVDMLGNCTCAVSANVAQDTANVTEGRELLFCRHVRKKKVPCLDTISQQLRRRVVTGCLQEHSSPRCGDSIDIAIQPIHCILLNQANVAVHNVLLSHAQRNPPDDKLPSLFNPPSRNRNVKVREEGPQSSF